jgi:peptide/nickel transport system substrate-binding protein
MAIDHQTVIQHGVWGFGEGLCTDHPSAVRPGYQPGDFCPQFSPAAANKVLDDKGWVRGADGVRTKGGQRLEFEYSTTSQNSWRPLVEAIIQRNLQAIGIKLDIQNYDPAAFFGSILPAGKASPPTGAVAGRYDIAEYLQGFSYDPDDSSFGACDQFPPQGHNFDFYCNPALDALYKQELATTDPGVRQHVFEQLHQIYLTAFPFVTLFGGPTWPAIVRKGTHNYQLSPFGFGPTNIWEWWCDNGKC